MQALLRAKDVELREARDAAAAATLSAANRAQVEALQQEVQAAQDAAAAAQGAAREAEERTELQARDCRCKLGPGSGTGFCWA